MKQYGWNCELVLADGETKRPVSVSIIWTAETRNAVTIRDEESGEMLVDERNLATPMPVMNELQGKMPLHPDSARWLYTRWNRLWNSRLEAGRCESATNSWMLTRSGRPAFRKEEAGRPDISLQPLFIADEQN